MAGLLDLIQARRAKRYADGGFAYPGSVLAAHAQLAQQKAAQDAQVRNGAFSTAPPPPPQADLSAGPDPSAPTIQSTELASTGQVPRLLEAGGHDLAGGFENALAATSAALGGDALAGTMHAAAQEHAARAAALTPDQIQNIHDIHGVGDGIQYVGQQLVRGAPMLGAMALGGGIARTFGAPAIAGVAAPSMALNTGSAYQQMADADPAGATSKATGMHALAAGAVNAALDTAAYGYAAKLSPFAKGLLAKGVSESLPGHIARSLVTEGATGAARQYVNDVGTKMLLGNPQAFGLTPDDISGLENAAAQNAAATSPLGVAGHFGRGIATGIDKTMDLAGKGLKAAGFGEKPEPPEGGAPAAPEPSMGTKLGAGLASMIDDPAKIVQAGAQAVDWLREQPVVGAAIKQGGDFFGALNQSQRVGKISDWLGQRADQVQQGYDAFKSAYADQLGDNANLAGAPDRYKALLAHALGAGGLDGAALGRMSGEKLAAFINGFNDKLPQLESTTGAIFNTVGGVAEAGLKGTVQGTKNFAQSFNDNADLSNLKEGIGNPNLEQGLAKAGTVAGTGAGLAATGVDKAFGAASDLASQVGAGVSKAAKTFNASRPETKEAVTGIADALKPADPLQERVAAAQQAHRDALNAAVDAIDTPREKELRDAAFAAKENYRSVLNDAAGKASDEMASAPKKSLSSPLTDDQRTLRDSFKQDNQNLKDNPQAAVMLAKIFAPLSLDNKAFDAALAQPGVASHIATLTDMHPEQFKQYVMSELGRRTPDDGRDTGPTQIEDSNKFVTPDNPTNIDGIGAEDGENLADLQARLDEEAKNNPDSEQLQIGGLNETGARHPGMSPERFDGMLSTARHARDGTVTDVGKPATFGGNAKVNVIRTTHDADTGAQLDTKTTPQEVNFPNIARAWARQREMSQKGRAVGESRQEKFDNNLKDGLSAMLNGWSETDKNGNPVDVKVQPANGKSGETISRDDLHKWIRQDSVVGGTKVKPRTFADVNESGKATQAVDLPSAVDQYKAKIDDAMDQAEQKAVESGRDPEKARARAQAWAERVHTDPVVRMAAEKIEGRLIKDVPDPGRQAEIIEKAIEYAAKPEGTSVKDVPSELLQLPPEVLQHGKARLIAELDGIQERVSQRQRSEQESSIDDANFRDNQPEDSDHLTEDASGQYINYAADQAAGKGKTSPAYKRGRMEEPPLSPERSQGLRNQFMEERANVRGKVTHDRPQQPVEGRQGEVGEGAPVIHTDAGPMPMRPSDKPYAEAREAHPGEPSTRFGGPEPQPPEVPRKQVGPNAEESRALSQGKSLADLKRDYAEAKNGIGKAVARKALEAAGKVNNSLEVEAQRINFQLQRHLGDKGYDYTPVTPEDLILEDYAPGMDPHDPENWVQKKGPPKLTVVGKGAAPKKAKPGSAFGPPTTPIEDQIHMENLRERADTAIKSGEKNIPVNPTEIRALLRDAEAQGRAKAEAHDAIAKQSGGPTFAEATKLRQDEIKAGSYGFREGKNGGVYSWREPGLNRRTDEIPPESKVTIARRGKEFVVNDGKADVGTFPDLAKAAQTAYGLVKQERSAEPKKARPAK